MVEKGKFETTEKRIRTAVSSRFVTVGVVVSVLALIATIVGVIIVLRSEKTEVTAQVLACDELTKYSPVAELKGSFTYLGEEVAHLWKLKVKFINSGDKTIVGVGSQTNVLGEGLNFVFPDDTRILKIENEADTFDSNIMQPKSNQLQIQFSQWRSGEYRIESFYIASDYPLDENPCPTTTTREIIDGNVVIQDLTEERPHERLSVIDRLPRVISTPGKIIGGVSAGGLALAFIIILAWAWMDTVKKLMWKRRYLSHFRVYLNQVEPKISKRRKRLYMEMPEVLPDELWTTFEGKKAGWSTGFSDKSTATIVTAILIFVAVGLSCLILMLFPV